MRKLEIGPGDMPLSDKDPEWDAVDSAPRVKVDYTASWGFEVLPIPDNSYDLVFASHVIEHIPWYKTQFALEDVLRILAPGGTFEVWTVDFAVCIRAYLKHEYIDDWDAGGLIKCWQHSVAGRIFSYEKHEIPQMWHKAYFDEDYLRQCLTNAGFRDIQQLKETRGHDHGPVNLGMSGRKL